MSHQGDELLRYFASEKNAGALALAIGVLAFLFSFLLWRSGSPFRAMVWPLVFVGLFEVGVGIGLLVRTDRQVAALQDSFASSPAEARAAELARMTRVNRFFKVIEAMEIVLLAAGLLAALFLRSRPALAAVGMGFLIQASILLVFDLMAEHRAHAYTRWLEGPTRESGVLEGPDRAGGNA